MMLVVYNKAHFFLFFFFWGGRLYKKIELSISRINQNTFWYRNMMFWYQKLIVRISDIGDYFRRYGKIWKKSPPDIPYLYHKPCELNVIYSSRYDDTLSLCNKPDISLYINSGYFYWRCSTLTPAWKSNYIYSGTSIENASLRSIIKCWMKLFVHSQTPTVQPLKFGNGQVILSHILLGMWLLIHAEIQAIHNVSKRGPWYILESMRWVHNGGETSCFL